MEMLKEMAIFAQVVDSAGFSAAARHLGLTTSAVSRHVSRLETHMGGRLLQRTTRSVALTELGQQVYQGCNRMLSTAREIHALAGRYSARPNGVIQVTAPIVFGQVWLAPKLPAFLALYPEVDIQLTLVDRTVDLIDEGIDLAIRIARDLAPGLAARPLCSLRYILVASPNYLAKNARPDRPEQLPEHQCIYLGYARFRDYWTLQQGEQEVRIKVPTRITINNSSAILAAVLADGGIGLLPDFTAQVALRDGMVLQILPEWELKEPYTGAAYAVYQPGKHLALKLRVFIDHLVAKSD
ncbi:LysR family transcriptional regulator [Undibacterium sp.]|jgi:DNA-binding transcriptional LysR family regulator|uniref:LysR family transcriptional regulator n=1 Tax=Undibacterium sp. TaxID=1914977 RepID=UPI0025E43306|nr:LysR family transcriptional regulator [Undibacterium sp.]